MCVSLKNSITIFVIPLSKIPIFRPKTLSWTYDLGMTFNDLERLGRLGNRLGRLGNGSGDSGIDSGGSGMNREARK